MLRTVLFILLSLANAAMAQESAQDIGVRRAAFAAELFMESCFAHLGDGKALTRWVRSRGYGQTDPAFSKAVLQGDPGVVWSASNDIGDFVILQKLDGNCEVWARRAHGQAAAESFEKAIRDARRPGRRIERDPDRAIEAGGVAYRQIAYFMQQEGAAGGWLLVAIVSDSDRADVQVRLSADRTR